MAESFAPLRIENDSMTMYFIARDSPRLSHKSLKRRLFGTRGVPAGSLGACRSPTGTAYELARRSYRTAAYRGAEKRFVGGLHRGTRIGDAQTSHSLRGSDFPSLCARRTFRESPSRIAAFGEEPR